MQNLFRERLIIFKLVVSAYEIFHESKGNEQIVMVLKGE